jgi:molecular chaperone GrpE
VTHPAHDDQQQPVAPEGVQSPADGGGEPTPVEPVETPDGASPGDTGGAGPGQPDLESEAALDEEIEDDLTRAKRDLADLTGDLQRLQAEYLNYKRRVDRDREAVRDTATAAVLTSLLPVLDDIGRARDHGELVGGFKAVAESFERIVGGLGLEAFGVEGDEFDPRIHEALMHSYDDNVDQPVAKAVLQVGYRFGDRVVRPARVAVVEPAGSADVPLDPTQLGDEGAMGDHKADEKPAGEGDDKTSE